VFAGSAVVFLSAAALTVRFRGVAAHGGRASTVVGIRDVARDTVAVVRDPHVTGILVVSGLRTFVRGMWIAIAVIASLRLLHAGSAGVGLLMLAAGIGSLMAVPLSAALISRPRLGTPAALALVACGIPLGLVAGVPLLDVALVLVAAWGIGMAVADVATLSVLHRLLAAPLLPRVTAAIESAKLALEGTGAFLAPVLVYWIGVRGALVVAALPLPVVVAVGWRTLHRVDATASARSRVLALLHDVPCLRPLDMAALDALAGRVTTASVSAGSEVVTQGDPGDGFYMVDSGNADVLVDGYVVGVVGPGDSFGERALLRDTARTATVRATDAMRLLRLSREDFLASLTGQEDGGVTRHDEAAPSGGVEWSRRQRIDLLSRVSLLSHLDAGALGSLADSSIVDRWDQGATIVRQGEEGDRFYVLLDGRARVSVGADTVAELHPGDQFGEIALLHDVPRRADVSASTPVITLSLGREAFMPAVRSRIMQG
jgi:CRP-like cAMP-binding protein